MLRREFPEVRGPFTPGLKRHPSISKRLRILTMRIAKIVVTTIVVVLMIVVVVPLQRLSPAHRHLRVRHFLQKCDREFVKQLL